jgi:hypothetical protein
VYRCAPISAGNTFQDLPRLRETAENTEGYIHVTNINTVKVIDKQGLSEPKHCDNAETNANSENARSRMEVSSTGKRESGGKEDESGTGSVWAAGFLHFTARSRLWRVLKVMNHLFL